MPDKDRLICKAIAYAETGNCKKAKYENSCWGVMTWRNGVRYQKRYDSYEEGLQDCIRIWGLYYGEVNLQNAIRWTGNDRPHDWLRIVRQKYNEVIQ